MGTSTGTPRRVIIAVLAAVAVIGVGPSAQAQEPEPSEPVVVAGDGATTRGRGTVLRQRDVAVDVGALRRQAAGEVRLDLFDDVEVVADVAPSPSGADGWQAWSGTVEGEPDSSVVVATGGGRTSALVVVPGATYRVRTDAAGGQVAQEIRPLPSEGDDAVGVGGSAGSSAGDEGAPGAPGAAVEGDLPSYHVVDVLVAYTPQALAQAGSLAALKEEAAMSVTVSNSAFSTTGINGRFRLAGTYAVPENLDCDDLGVIRGDGDGVADGVHSRRDQLGADIVTVFSGAGCGIGYRPINSFGLNDSSLPFSVVGYAWAVDNLTFPHELGHNMGMHHDRYVVDPSSPQLYPYGFGWVNVAGGWRTIMAYNQRCSDSGTYCTRLPRFSNPALTYNGAPTGSPSTAADAADGRRVLDATFPVIAEHRSTPAPFTTWTRFVQQQARDFEFGASVPSGTAAALSAQLSSGALKPGNHVESTMRGAFAAAYAPVIRLYSAYFRRLPDRSGLDYWVGQLRGGMSIPSMSARFASSPEFTELYGSLDNRAFVDRIYANVLGRPGDASGVAYWTGVLDRREKTRGQVMVGFSESAENKTRRARPVDVVMVYRGLLGRMPTAGEQTAAVNRLGAGTALKRIILELMATTPYADRVVR